MGFWAQAVIGLVFCGTPCEISLPSTLSRRVEFADVVFIAELSDSRFFKDAPFDQPSGQTNARIFHLLKSHKALKGRTEITLSGFIPIAERQSVVAIVMSKVDDDLISPFHFVPNSPEFDEYLKRAIAVQHQPPIERMSFFFKYLDYANTYVSKDAYVEVASFSYQDLRAAEDAIDANFIRQRFLDPHTECFRLGTYGFLLGIRNAPQSKQMILDILRDPKKRPLSGVDGLMGGLVVLDPKEGVDFVVNAINSSEHDFNFRYAALRTVTRFILTDLPEIDRNMIFDRLKPAIQIKDITDLVIDEYRKAKVWTPTKEVLAIFNDPKFNVNVVKRAVVRYALQCPDPEAASFVAQLRKDDPQMVADVEDILRFEEASQIKATPAGDGKT